MVNGNGISAVYRGRNVQYGFSSPGNSHYADVEDLGSYSDSAPAAIQRTSTDSSSSSNDGHSIAARDRDLATQFQHDYPDMVETITFDYRSSEPPGRQRANQDYYNILEIASNRLREDGSVHDDSSGDEAVRKKKRKKKSKTKKDKRKSRRRASEVEQQDAVERAHGSAIFQSLCPSSMRISRKDKHAETADHAGDKHWNCIKDNDNNDPNDDLPIFTTGKYTHWNPAALVTAAHANEKIDRNGFYKSMKKRADLAVQSLRTGHQNVINNEYNLKNIGKTGDTTYHPAPRSRNIVWGDESILTRDESVTDHEVCAEKSIRLPDEGEEDLCSSELNQSMEHFMENQKRVQNLMWNEKRLREGIIMLVSIILVGTCLGIYLSRSGKDSPFSPPTSTPLLGENNDVNQNDPPPRPLPPPPTSIELAENSNLHVITETELQNILKSITTGTSVFDNPHSPQSKALNWLKNDVHNHNVTTEARVAQRYALATLYYSTNGTGWQTRSQWGSGHECDWYGVGCEAGENGTVSVTYLDLNSNLLDGTIPPEIGYILTLEQIHLWGNNLRGTIPNTISQLVNVHTLYLDKNYLDGEMSDIFNSMKSLKHLDLSHNRLRGHIPHGLGSLINLRDLRLSNNLFSSSLPTSFISLSNLETLLLDANALSGSLPPLMGDMSSLVTLRLNGNDIEGHLPNFINAVNLEEVHLDGNYFSGPIPTFGSTRLRELYLGQNSLTGSIPDSIGELIKLEIFKANGNGLSSTISSTLSRATQLNILDLSNNKLSGEIPREFAELIMLHELRLDHNRLRGFPSWLGSMPHIQIVHLNNNLLDGHLELSLDVGDLNDLTEFAIQNNDITGVVDEFMCDLLLNVLTSDCWGSPPQVDCVSLGVHPLLLVLFIVNPYLFSLSLLMLRS